MDINLAPLMNYGIELLGMVLMLAASWLVSWLGRKTKLDALAPELDQIIEDGIGFAVGKAKAWSGDADITKYHVKNEVVGEVLQYVTRNGPKTAKKLGYSSDQLRDKIEARLGLQDASRGAG